MEPNLLPFTGGGSTPVQYDLDLRPWTYFVHYRHGELNLYGVENGEVSFLESEVLLRVQIGGEYDGSWNARETNVYLQILSKSITSRCFDTADYPLKADVRRHRDYELGPIPTYPIGVICGIHEPSPPSDDAMNRHIRKKRKLREIHDHNNSCFAYVPAQDVALWIAAHPSEHLAFQNLMPEMWRFVAQDLEL